MWVDTKKESIEEYYELIFRISMNVPRIIGYILYYCYESKIAYGNPINKASLEDASEKYYDLTIVTDMEANPQNIEALDSNLIERVSDLVAGV